MFMQFVVHTNFQTLRLLSQMLGSQWPMSLSIGVHPQKIADWRPEGRDKKEKVIRWWQKEQKTFIYHQIQTHKLWLISLRPQWFLNFDGSTEHNSAKRRHHLSNIIKLFPRSPYLLGFNYLPLWVLFWKKTRVFSGGQPLNWVAPCLIMKVALDEIIDLQPEEWK